MRAARAEYFAANGFSEAGYTDRFVKLQLGPLPFYILNSAARVRSVRLHDIHHVLTGYETTWAGEGEIAAWEIGSSCADHWAAWGLNLSGLASGLAVAPREVFDAFVRGRHSANLYRGEFEPSLLGLRVGALRSRLGLDRAIPSATAGDRLAFAGWSVAGVFTLALSAAPLLLAVAGVARLACAS